MPLSGTSCGQIITEKHDRKLLCATRIGCQKRTAFLPGIGSATLLGIDADTGTLEAGKFADIVALPGDVLQNIRATEKPVMVMKHGETVVLH